MASTPNPSTVQASQGSQVGVRRSNTNAHPAVSATTPASAIRAPIPARSRHSTAAPIPTSAAIAGARATR